MNKIIYKKFKTFTMIKYYNYYITRLIEEVLVVDNKNNDNDLYEIIDLIKDEKEFKNLLDSSTEKHKINELKKYDIKRNILKKEAQSKIKIFIIQKSITYCSEYYNSYCNIFYIV
jgi:hypothetical protein